MSSIYSPETVTNVFDNIKKTREGTAIFTFPNTAVKCPGAPQKIAYLAEDYWRKVINILTYLYFHYLQITQFNNYLYSLFMIVIYLIAATSQVEY